jgi:protein involved in polysaccharide export with SLBB domain
MGPGIQRPGTYNLPQNGRLTLTRLVAAAGGFSQIATPERVDLTRVVGDRGQATIRLNARAIFEGTHPDVRLKSDDMLNFGTNFFATPMAVIRNGFRMSYGFGFLVDRNFGNDIFGAPPTRIEGN